MGCIIRRDAVARHQRRWASPTSTTSTLCARNGRLSWQWPLCWRARGGQDGPGWRLRAAEPLNPLESDLLTLYREEENHKKHMERRIKSAKSTLPVARTGMMSAACS